MLYSPTQDPLEAKGDLLNSNCLKSNVEVTVVIL